MSIGLYIYKGDLTGQYVVGVSWGRLFSSKAFKVVNIEKEGKTNSFPSDRWCNKKEILLVDTFRIIGGKSLEEKHRFLKEQIIFYRDNQCTLLHRYARKQ